MPMPKLDPSRFVTAYLADPTHKLPLPNRGGRLFLAAGETVDTFDPVYAHLLADRSLTLTAPAAVPITAPAGEAEHQATTTPPEAPVTEPEQTH